MILWVFIVILLFLELLSYIDLTNIEDFSKFKYKDIFDPKVKELLEDENISTNIAEYYEKYNKLIEDSLF